MSMVAQYIKDNSQNLKTKSNAYFSYLSILSSCCQLQFQASVPLGAVVAGDGEASRDHFLVQQLSICHV